MESLDKARLCLNIIDERKAVDPILFDVGKMTSLTDYFIVTSGHSSRQVQAISHHVARSMREKGFRPYGVEGEREGHWILMDYGDVVIHIFYQPVREFYDLEGLWSEAPRVGFHEKKPEKS
jgi:ribosome-associated protein